jgi:hypothetical protein
MSGAVVTAPEDVRMQCPFCGRQLLKSETDAAADAWMNFHIRDRKCVE